MSLLATHQIQGSYAPSSPSWKRRIRLTQSRTAFCTVQRMHINLSKHTSCLCGEAPLTHSSKRKSFNISSYKSDRQSDEYKDGVRGSNSENGYINRSYISRDKKETLSGLPKVQNIHTHSTFDADLTTVGSLAMHKLFKSWLNFFPFASLNEDETLVGPSLNKRLETDHKILEYGILKTIWCKFWGMDAMIKIPAILFIPLLLIVNMKYGAHVAKELSPLWIGGPLLIALYIKMIQVLCSLYVFSFKQSVKAVKNFTDGNDKESIRAHLWQHVVYFRNLDYKDESKRIWRDFQVWIEDKCLDFVESMWSYRGLVRFMKIVKIG